THTHPFSQEIMEVPLPDRFKAPVIAVYEGTTDPDDHVETFEGHMNLHGYDEAIMCRAFRNTLSGAARRWFTSLGPDSIDSWAELKAQFTTQFIGVKKYVPSKSKLSHLLQGPNESLKDWLACFGRERAMCGKVTDQEALMGAMFSIRGPSFKKSLWRREPTTYQEFLDRAQGFINEEEAEKAEKTILKSKVVVPNEENDDHLSKRKNKRRNPGFKPENN
ncbi:hypothetical protein, partial [Escherichia coli]|uniref:hypothetical protein n=1 Tax=Escherichia coli TaxID=562 RepID=UPI002244B990